MPFRNDPAQLGPGASGLRRKSRCSEAGGSGGGGEEERMNLTGYDALGQVQRIKALNQKRPQKRQDPINVLSKAREKHHTAKEALELPSMAVEGSTRAEQLASISSAYVLNDADLEREIEAEVEEVMARAVELSAGQGLTATIFLDGEGRDVLDLVMEERSSGPRSSSRLAMDKVKQRELARSPSPSPSSSAGKLPKVRFTGSDPLSVRTSSQGYSPAPPSPLSVRFAAKISQSSPDPRAAPRDCDSADVCEPADLVTLLSRMDGDDATLPQGRRRSSSGCSFAAASPSPSLSRVGRRPVIRGLKSDAVVEQPALIPAHLATPAATSFLGALGNAPRRLQPTPNRLQPTPDPTEPYPAPRTSQGGNRQDSLARASSGLLIPATRPHRTVSSDMLAAVADDNASSDADSSSRTRLPVLPVLMGARSARLGSLSESWAAWATGTAGGFRQATTVSSSGQALLVGVSGPQPLQDQGGMPSPDWSLDSCFPEPWERQPTMRSVAPSPSPSTHSMPSRSQSRQRISSTGLPFLPIAPAGGQPGLQPLIRLPQPCRQPLAN